LRTKVLRFAGQLLLARSSSLADYEDGCAFHPMTSEPEIVECHSGYTYADRPIALRWEGERLPIVEIEARWRIPGGQRFRVRVEDGRVFELFYGELYDEWRIHLL
jgi:hypothetical protein